MQMVSTNANETGVIKLRVGVPKKKGFEQFVNVVWDSHENKYNDSGYCMDVFNAVVSNLTFNVSLQIQPYVFDESEDSAGKYDTLLHQIPAKVRN
jgi:ionotropic glutamate receptor